MKKIYILSIFMKVIFVQFSFGQIGQELNSKYMASKTNVNSFMQFTLPKKTVDINPQSFQPNFPMSSSDDAIQLLKTEIASRFAQKDTAIKKEIDDSRAKLEKLSNLISGAKKDSLNDADLQYQIDTSYNQIQKRSQALITKLNTINAARLKFEELINQMTNSNSLLEMDSLIQAKKNLDDGYERLSNNYEKFIFKDYNGLTDYVDKKNTEIKAKRNKLNADSVPSDKELSALPGASIFGSRIVPNIALVGSKTFSGSDNAFGFGGELRFFTGGTSDGVAKGMQNYFIPEASTYGIQINASLGLSSDPKNDIKRFIVNSSFNYLGKNIKIDSSNTFSTSVIHYKLGLQYILVKNAISAYINYNGILPIDNISNVEKYIDKASKWREFTDVGLKLYFDLMPKKSFFLLMDLGFTLVNSTVSDIVKTKDLAIPTVKLSLRKDFDF